MSNHKKKLSPREAMIIPTSNDPTRKLRLYLAHPFDSRQNIRGLELRLETKCPKLELVNPFYDVDRADVDAFDKGEYERYEKLDPVKIVTGDLQQIHEADGILAVVDGSLSYGTIMEIAHGFLMGKLIYIVVSNGHIKHPWLQFHGTRLFESWKDFEKFIVEKLNA